MRIRLLFRAAVVGALTALLPAIASAQAPAAFPTRPITIVVPLAPGGGTEQETRLYAQKILETEGYTLLIDNRPGAAGTVGTAFVARAAPDGYTLLQVIADHTITPASYPDLPYDPVKDFAPISLISKRPYILMLHPSVPARTLVDYIAYARAHPGALNYATAGIGGGIHLAGAWLHHATNTQVTFVHYKSTGAYTADLSTGRVQVTTTTPINAMAYIKSGKLHPLAVTLNTRLEQLPDLPTISEQVVPGYELASWMGYAATGGTPAAIINKLNADFTKASRAPAIADKLKSEGIVHVRSTPEQFRQHLVSEVARWATLVKQIGLKLAE